MNERDRLAADPLAIIRALADDAANCPEDNCGDHDVPIDLAIAAMGTLNEERLARAREELAALEHEQWASWATTLMATEAISEERRRRWSKLLVDYDELTEEQKDQDRRWADRSLVAIAKAYREDAG